ncbi:MAG TPA: DNA gyrase inhibitor YacG [Gammaproteobacteria bacterium]|nr:DNA gyrase inhibitor YacG [Gammaproteobacteria bacterium]
MIIECPTCKKKIEWSEQNLFRPFCSERCKLIDLGAWADDKYRIPDRQAVDPEAYMEANNDEDDSDQE